MHVGFNIKKHHLILKHAVVDETYWTTSIHFKINSHCYQTKILGNVIFTIYFIPC